MKDQLLLGGADGGAVALADPEYRSRRNRRRGRRERSERVSIEFVDDLGGLVPFTSFDLSSLGVYLHSDLLLSPGEEVQLLISLPALAQPLHVRGEVIRSDVGSELRAPGMGVAFRGLGDEDQLLLTRFVSRTCNGHV